MGQQSGPTSSVAVERQDGIGLPSIEELERQFAGGPSDGTPAEAFTNAIVTITRNAHDDVQDRVVTLSLDDEPWDRLRYGQVLTRHVPPGRHVIKGHNTMLTTTFEFDAAPGEHVRVRCANAVSRGGALLMLIIGWAMLRVRFERDHDAA